MSILMYLSDRNMIKYISPLIRIGLPDSSEFESKLVTCYIIWMHIMFEICIWSISLSPSYDRFIYFSSISFTMFITSYPDSDIHCIIFHAVESCTSDESEWFTFEYKILEHLSSLHGFHNIDYKIHLFIIIRHQLTHISLLVCFTEFLRQFSDIYPPIHRKRKQKTSCCVHMLMDEIMMWIREERHGELLCNNRWINSYNSIPINNPYFIKLKILFFPNKLRKIRFKIF